MTHVPVKTVRSACVLPSPPMSMHVLLQVSHWVDGGRKCAVSFTETIKCEMNEITIYVSYLHTAVSELCFLSTEKYTTDCPPTLVYDYQMTSCGRTCRSLSQSDFTCEAELVPFDGCGCAEGTYLNEKGKCVSATQCSCYSGDMVVQPEHSIKVNGKTWWGYQYLQKKYCRTFVFNWTKIIFNQWFLSSTD